jgi:hypothetical protein
MQCVHTNSRLAKVVSVKFPTLAVGVQCKTSKQAVNLNMHQDGGHTSTRILEILEMKSELSGSQLRSEMLCESGGSLGTKSKGNVRR